MGFLVEGCHPGCIPTRHCMHDERLAAARRRLGELVNSVAMQMACLIRRSSDLEDADEALSDHVSAMDEVCRKVIRPTHSVTILVLHSGHSLLVAIMRSEQS